MNALETLVSANDTALQVITTLQDRLLDATRDAAESYPATKLATLPKLPAPDPALTQDVVEEAFAFRSKLLDANRSFTLGLIDAWTPKSSAKVSASTAAKK